MSPGLQTGRYEILETLGRGATCRVDKARDTIIGRTVALKSILQGFGKNSEEQFMREAQTIGRLSHSAIAQLYDVNTDSSGTPFLVMEYVPGKNLEEHIARGPVPFSTAAVWAADVAMALNAAHREGIIHGDVKPSNIRITDEGKVKLVDFGVARFASQITGSDRVLGTPAYLSPEQIEGKKQDARSDIFSLGIVLYEAITGVRPFSGDSLGDVCAQILTEQPISPSKLNPAIPRPFDRILARCLAKDPAQRYQTGSELARALYLVARSANHSSAPAKRLYWLFRPAHLRDLSAIAATILLIAGATITLGSLKNLIQPRSTPKTASAHAKLIQATRSEKEIAENEVDTAPARHEAPALSSLKKKSAKTTKPTRQLSSTPIDSRLPRR
ncbi:MAG TPA: serine/threonine-protein kinase [Candidatus Acidoferrum sp.]|nr:serine/threonine-protein kinase [Candidatus Acidoferrum sp.]